MNDVTNLDAVAKPLRRIVWITLLQCLFVGSLVATFVARFIEEQMHEYAYEKDQKTVVIAASEDISAGSVICETNLGTLTVSKRQIPDGVVMEADARVLFGHKAIVPMKKMQPIQWVYTDIMITNR